MKFLLTLMLILLTVTLVFSQTLKVEPYGVSPAAVKADTLGNPNYLGIKDRTFTGLTNVGVETKVYLIGSFEDSTLTASGWNILSQPNGSIASLSEPTDVDESSQIVTFIPDQAGAYEVEFYDGVTSDTVAITAGTYVGAVKENCYCHAPGGFVGDVITPWSGTGHATFLERSLDGLNGSHYSASCISCHTVGYDLDADNGGFDDYEFVFPDTFFVGMADSMYKTYPEAMQLANIQCESCHGPASGHMKFGMATNLGPDNCAYCHDDDHYHVYPSQWEFSKHSSGEHLYNASSSGGSCAPCHNGQGFVDYVKGKDQTVADEVPITCGTCHDPHDATNEYQIRILDAELENGQVITEGGMGKLCMNCHRARRDAAEYTDNYLENLSSHYGPHHGPQADMLAGTNAPTFGLSLPSSAHLAGIEDACVNCHMYESGSHGEHDPETGELTSAGMHSFSMVDKNGVDNVAACAPCHGTFGDSFSDKKFYLNGNADHDGNGIAEGLQLEVHGLLDTLKALLPQDDGEVSINDSSVTLAEAQAGYNYFLVEEDRSMGVHNPAFAVTLLQASINALRGVTSIFAQDGGVPMQYALSQNYPNPFNPSTEIEFSIKKAGDVSLKVYDLLGREVMTLVDENMAAGTYKVRFDGTNLASGVYIYRIVASDFSAIKKMVLVK